MKLSGHHWGHSGTSKSLHSAHIKRQVQEDTRTLHQCLKIKIRGAVQDGKVFCFSTVL